jgi:hypothetical protein
LQPGCRIFTPRRFRRSSGLPGRVADRRPAEGLCYNQPPAQEARDIVPGASDRGQRHGDQQFTLTQTQTEPGTSALAFSMPTAAPPAARAAAHQYPRHFDAILNQLRRLSEADVLPRSGPASPK